MLVMYDVLISCYVYVAILSGEECQYGLFYVWLIIVWVCSVYSQSGGTLCMLVSISYKLIL